jgi:hypothetical protein
MGTDHRGRRLGDNHRATPRVQQALQRYYKIDSDTAQDVINEHRAGRDYLDDEYYGVDYSTPYHPDKPVPDDDNIGNRIDHIPTAISAAVESRSGKNSMGYSSPYEYPPTVKIKESKDPADGIFY